MVCNCKICRKNLGELVNELYQTGSPIDVIVETLVTNHQCETNEDTTRRHLEKAGLYVSVGSSSGSIAVEPPYEFDLNAISFDRYDFDSGLPTEVVTYLQKVHLGLYFKQLEIVAREQDDFYHGVRDTPPGQSVTRLKQLYELLDNITGISIYANQQAAIKKVELMGLSIEKFSAYVMPEEQTDV
jgi:hypothetical protein